MSLSRRLTSSAFGMDPDYSRTSPVFPLRIADSSRRQLSEQDNSQSAIRNSEWDPAAKEHAAPGRIRAVAGAAIVSTTDILEIRQAPRAVRRCETGRAGQNEKNDLELKARNQAHSVHLGIFQLHGYHETRSPSGRDFSKSEFLITSSGPPSAGFFPIPLRSSRLRD